LSFSIKDDHFEIFAKSAAGLIQLRKIRYFTS